jgi:hypothetical protein
MLLGSLTGLEMRAPREKLKAKPRLGQVEILAEGLDKTRRGTYYKWQIAHRLGRLARDFLIQRGDRTDVKDLGPLSGRDWQPSEPVNAYLDAGLHGSFADFPNQPWRFRRPEPTPLDIDVEVAVEFLESQIKPQMNADKQR